MKALTPYEVESFIRDGYIRLDHAFPVEWAAECRNILWKLTGLDPEDRSTWTKPVVRIADVSSEPFVAAANTPVLHRAFDQLAGEGNWLPRKSLGSFPIRFPSPEPAGDTGWHVDAGFPGGDPNDYLTWRINFRSKGRALLMLFLFSDTGERDAPARIRVGSHSDVARLLYPEGEKGLTFMELAQKLEITAGRPEVNATGRAGTVYLCHPFLVHAAQDHQGIYPRFLAQPPLLTTKDFPIDTACGLTPVETAIHTAILPPYYNSGS